MIKRKLIILSLEVLIILGFSAIAFMAIEANAYGGYYDEQGYYHDLMGCLHDEHGVLPCHPERTSNPKPVIHSLKPSSIDEIRQRTTINIKGSGFTPNSIVRKNNVNRPAIFIDSNNLLVDIYPGEVPSNQAEFFLTVFNGEPGGGYSNASVFTIKNNAAAVKSINTVTHSTVYHNIDHVYNHNYISNNTVSRTTGTYNNRYNDNVATGNYYYPNGSQDNTNYNDVNESYGNLTANALYGSNGFMPSGLMQWIFFAILILVIIYLWRYVFDSKEKYMATPMKQA